MVLVIREDYSAYGSGKLWICSPHALHTEHDRIGTVFGASHYPSRDHALVDGNEWVAMGTLVAFYGINGRRLTLTTPPASRIAPQLIKTAALRSAAWCRPRSALAWRPRGRGRAIHCLRCRRSPARTGTFPADRARDCPAPKRTSHDRTSVLLTTRSTESAAGGHDETASASAEPGGMEFL